MEIFDQLKQLEGLGPAGILLLFLCCLGAALKYARWPKDNRIIPVILLVLGAGGYPFLARKADMDYTSTLILYNFAVGGVIGWASVGAHQLLKQVLPLLFPKNGNTEILEKPPEPPTV